MKKITGKKILILATNSFEQAELEVPRDRLKEAGATVDVVSPEAGEINGWDRKDWGRPVKGDKMLGAYRGIAQRCVTPAVVAAHLAIVGGA
jgi:protease I